MLVITGIGREPYRMHVSGWLIHLLVRALAESMDVRSMIHMSRRLIRNYDLYEQTGFSRNMSIPNKDAAARIVRDMKDRELIIPFVTLLIDIHQKGLGGRKYRIPYLKEAVREMEKTGVIYDRNSRMFCENPLVRRTNNWGVLREHEEYIFTFLHTDLVGNTELVRRNPEDIVHAAYSDLRKIVQSAVEKRNGRIWNWEGDGGLAAFYFSNKSTCAVLSAIEIIHELYIYNRISCRLNKPLRVRIAVHSGPCRFRRDFEQLESDTVNKTIEIQSRHTRPDTATISDGVYHMLDGTLAGRMENLNVQTSAPFYSYKLKWEK